jgi:hypothetical protein
MIADSFITSVAVAPVSCKGLDFRAALCLLKVYSRAGNAAGLN